MDVRCEKCRTEYELDESKLKPGGVTVKCTVCGHMFKVRRARSTMTSEASPPPPEPPPSEPPARSRTDTPAPSGPDSPGGERTWLIRLEDGEIKTCQELATLQKWIVAGHVSRGCEISRTGKKWKQLGEIGELASFFEIADEAREVAAGRGVTPRPSLLRAEGSGPQRERPATHPRTIRRRSSMSETTARRPMGSAEGDREPAKLRSSPPGATDEVTKPSALSGLIESERARRAAENRRKVQHEAETVVAPAPVSPAAEAAAAAAPEPVRERTSGPMKGIARAATSDDAAFVRQPNKISIKGEFENGQFVATDNVDDEIEVPRSSAARWIVMGSLVVIAAASVAVYWLMARDSKPEAAAKGGAAPDAAVKIAAAQRSDAAPSPAVPDAAAAAAPDPSALSAQAMAAIAADVPVGLDRAAEALAAVTGDDATLLIARSRVESARAQHAIDGAGGGPASAASRELAAQAKAQAATALELADKALAAAPDSPAAIIAKAIALVVSARPAREIETLVGKVLAASPQDGEALLVRGVLLARDGRRREARKVLSPLAEAGDVRARYRLARVELDDKAFDAARTAVQAVLAAQPEHTGASALAKQIEALAGTSSQPESGAETGGIDSYDRLLERGDRAAERGNTAEAMKWYAKALDIQPSGVAALTGLGYCHLDRKQFASAQAKFRAALGISSRYQDALWGVAEAYQQQGLKEQAIEAYKDFLDKHAGSARATAARRMIAQLGGSIGAAKPPEGGDSKPPEEDDGKPPEGGDGKPPDGEGKTPEAPKDKPPEIVQPGGADGQ